MEQTDIRNYFIETITFSLAKKRPVLYRADIINKICE